MRSASRPTRSRRLYWLLGMLLATLLVGGMVPSVARVHAKEVDVVGTVDCGQRSGRHCDIGDQLRVWTDSLSGQRERVTLDVSWVRATLPSLDQDDEVTATVELRPDGTLQVLSLEADAHHDGTVNVGASTGSREVTEARHDRGAAQDRDQTDNGAGGAQPGVPTVVLNGTVRNAGTGAEIAGAAVRANGQTATTNAAGQFTLTGLPTGAVTLEASATGFVTQQQTVTLVTGTNTVLIALPTVQPDIAITVTWAAQPFDLDAHLSGPAAGGTRFHASFIDKNPVPYAALTMDTQTGFGPEQVVIRRDPTTGLFVPGEYRFWVENFSQSPEFDVSQARAVITQGGQQLGVFTAATATGDPRLDIWYVVKLTINAAGAVTLAPVQQFVSGTETTILGIPAGEGSK